MSLQEQIKLLVDQSGAKVGVALHHIESGEEVMLNADDYFPLASVFKIPILVEACYRFAAVGGIKPDDRWVLKNSLKNLPSGVLVFFDEGLTPTVRDLLMMMIIISDNTATDILIDRLTKSAINDRMISLGFDRIHLTMTVRELFEEIMPNADPLQDLYELEKSAEKIEIDRDKTRIYKLTPENNVGTPRQLAGLCAKIFAGQTPDRQWSDFALNVMLQQQLNDRIPRFLPAGTRVAHKTGTLSRVRNDAGIIYAADDSHVALSIFVLWDEELHPQDLRQARQEAFKMDTLMGEIALLAYEAYRH